MLVGDKMRHLILRGSAVFAALTAYPAYSSCLTDREIDAALGEQVRSGSFIANVGKLGTRPLCSGLPLAQHIQQMRETAFPEDAARLKAEELARKTAAIEREQSVAAALNEQVARQKAAQEQARRATIAQSAAPHNKTSQVAIAQPAKQNAVIRDLPVSDSNALIANAFARSFLNAPRFAIGRQMGMNTVSGGTMNISIMGMFSESYTFLVKDAVCKNGKGGKTCTYKLGLQAAVNVMGLQTPAVLPDWIKRTDTFKDTSVGLRSANVDAVTLRMAGAMKSGMPETSSQDEFDARLKRDRDAIQFTQDMWEAAH